MVIRHWGGKTRIRGCSFLTLFSDLFDVKLTMEGEVDSDEFNSPREKCNENHVHGSAEEVKKTAHTFIS